MNPGTFNAKKITRSHRLMKIHNLRAKDKLDNFTVRLSHYDAKDRAILKSWEDWFVSKDVPFATVDNGSFSVIWKERLSDAR